MIGNANKCNPETRVRRRMTSSDTSDEHSSDELLMNNTATTRLGVNFINIIRTNISYEHHFSSYILALLKNLYEKRARITLMKLTIGVNFSNNCTCGF